MKTKRSVWCQDIEHEESQDYIILPSLWLDGKTKYLGTIKKTLSEGQTQEIWKKE